MIVTVLFAYLIDYIGQKELHDIEKTKRVIYIQPISMKIIELYHRIMFLNLNEGRIEDKEYKFDDFEEFYKEKLRSDEALNLPLVMIYAMKARGWEFYKNYQELLAKLEQLANEY